MVYCCVSGVSYSYDSSASQLLELGVREFCSSVPNSHVKSRVYLGFCHGIAKGRDCKVEFNQPSYWLYSVPNLLVFQHLVILYLGGFVVRVLSEIECRIFKSVQENRVSWLDLAGDSRLQAARCSSRAKHSRR